ncbi:MAG: hypothetical protein K2Q13_04070 [Nitrosomonas sp.]|uniref:hypothetical protein n=1 Tax=Nitrosomonas sp. TaxID=42353 RepID=UPI0025FD281F|nr:hypothetical protein [Nitrosomonas sp.]MBY0474224.1 hypothetical protein [Nitrosomonas sp.]
MNWFGRQLEEHHLFRRLVIVFFLFVYLEVTRESFSYAYFAAELGISATDTVLVLGSLQTLMTLLMGYAFKIYSNSRLKD